ncbi:MAG TPA: type II toxin-antitoxin system ParD family antitoxin [Allosphingosinicella sp.]
MIEDALRLLEAREAKLDQLSSALQEGLDSGEAVDFDVNEWLEAKRTGPEREEAALISSSCEKRRTSFASAEFCISDKMPIRPLAELHSTQSSPISR